MVITGIILAAGTSSRMGRNKLLLEYKGHTVIEETIIQLDNSKVDNILVITGHDNKGIEKLVYRYEGNRIRVVYNDNYRSGRAESIKCAVRSLDPQTDAALFMVGDKPGVTAELIDRSIDRFRESKPSILYVKTPAGRGHPIIFARSMFDKLLVLKGDTIGDDLIARNMHEVVELPDSEIQVDIDMESDYIALTKNRPEGN